MKPILSCIALLALASLAPAQGVVKALARPVTTAAPPTARAQSCPAGCPCGCLQGYPCQCAARKAQAAKARVPVTPTTVRWIIVKGPSGPQYVGVPYPVGVAGGGSDPATIALIQQLLIAQTANHNAQMQALQSNHNAQMLAMRAPPTATPSAPCPGPNILVLPGDAGGGFVAPPAGTPVPPAGTPGGVIPPGGTPGIVIPPGGVPGIVIPPGGAPGIVIPKGGTPGITIPGGGAPAMPMAEGHTAGPPTGYQTYTRYRAKVVVWYAPLGRYAYLYTYTPPRSAPVYVIVPIPAPVATETRR